MDLVVRLFSKGVPTLGVLNRARALLSPKALLVWLWSLRGSFSGPWLGCKRWARVRFSWTRVRHTCSVSANCAGAWNFWYVRPDCVNNRPVKQYIVRGPFVTASLTTQNNKPHSKQNDALHCAEREHFSATFTCYRKRPVSHLWSRDELAAFKLLVFLLKEQCNISLLCKRFVLFFVLNVKIDRLDATDFYTGVIFTLTSRNVTWFYYRRVRVSI